MMQNIALFAGGDIGLRSLNCLLPLHCTGEIYLTVYPSGFDKSMNEVIAEHGRKNKIHIYNGSIDNLQKAYSIAADKNIRIIPVIVDITLRR